MWNLINEIEIVADKLKISTGKLSIAATEELIKSIYMKYASDKKRELLWENLVDTISVCNKDAWRWISDFIGDSDAIMFFNLADEKSSFLFSKGDDIVSILSETYGFEFYITNYNTEYLLCFNSHDYLIACGNAKQWLENR